MSFTEQTLKDLAQKITGICTASVEGHPRFLPYSEEKLGVTCNHFCLKVVAKGIINTITVFVKRLSDKLPANERQNFKDVFLQEVFFYDQVLSMFPVKSSDANSNWCPKFYAYEQEALFLQDMKSAGFRVLDDITDNITCLEAALKALGGLHGGSLVAEKKLEAGQKWSTLLEQSRVKERMFTTEGEAGLIANRALELVVELTKGRCERGKIESAFRRAFDLLGDSTMTRGLIHGNLESRNLLFNDTNERCVLIDFKTFRSAPIVLDVAQLLYLYASKGFREEHCKRLLRTYYAALIAEMRRDGDHKRNLEPKFETILSEYEQSKIFGLISAAMFKPIEAMYLNDARIFKDHALWQSFLFQGRIDAVKDEMSKHKHFEISVETAIDELLKSL